MIPLKDNIPSRKIPFVNYLLIALNAVVFFVELKFAGIQIESGGSALEGFIFNFGVIPRELFSDFFSNFYTIFTSMFIHGGWMHFIGNMLYLYIFGDNVEDRFGHVGYLAVYFICGATAALLQSVLAPSSVIPMVGASGAIAGVIGAYMLLYPRARILTLVFFGFFARVVEVPALIYLGLWFIIQFMSGTMSLASYAASGQEAGGVAFWAHIGGFLAGILTVLLKKSGQKSGRFRL